MVKLIAVLFFVSSLSAPAVLLAPLGEARAGSTTLATQQPKRAIRVCVGPLRAEFTADAAPRMVIGGPGCGGDQNAIFAIARVHVTNNAVSVRV